MFIKKIILPFSFMAMIQFCINPLGTDQQKLADEDTVWAIKVGMVNLYNTNIAGLPYGTYSISVACPQGGTVIIAGSTSPSGISDTAVDLLYDMADCKINEVSSSSASSLTVTLTLNGTANWTDLYNSTDYDHTINSQNLQMNGTAERTGCDSSHTCYNTGVSQTCAITLSDTKQLGVLRATTSGSICGRSVTWTY